MDHHRLSLAPMMDRTDRHFRYLCRLISRHTLLYTEMVTHDAVIFGKREQLLGFDPSESPIVLQLGGSDPKRLAEAAAIGEDWGYDEINLNVGCPSDRVQARAFGACLMKTPELVAECIGEMAARVKVPVTVKHRIGVDDLDAYEDMVNFVDIVQKAPCKTFIVHARKAWLKGLSPKENRNIPPLRYGEVHRLKAEFPHLKIEINGGIKTLDQVESHLAHVDGVMLGRVLHENPYLLAHADRRIFGDENAEIPTMFEVAERFMPYVEEQLAAGHPLLRVIRHAINLFHGVTGARQWRRYLSENAYKKDAGVEVVQAALDRVRDAQSHYEKRMQDYEARGAAS